MRQAKGYASILQEQVSVWDRMLEINNGKVPPGKCRQCSTSQVKKDAEKRVAEADVMGQEDMIEAQDLVDAHDPALDPASDWCCMYCVLLLQDDFMNKKPMIQHYVKGQGHVCLFLPQVSL